MAATVRVIPVSQGPFGIRIADQLRGRPPSRRFTIDELHAAFTERPDAVVVALWRPAPSVCERADELAHATGTAWLPVIMEDPSIRVGPLVRPGEGACFRCYANRRVQHDPRVPRTQDVDAADESDPAPSSAGFQRRHADVAARVVRMLLRSGRNGAGKMVTISPPAMSLSCDPVVACHGCDRCARPRQARDLRRLLRLNEPERLTTQ